MATDLVVTDPSTIGTPLDTTHPSPADAIERLPGNSPPLRKRKSWAKAPKDSKIRKVALSVVALRAQGLKYAEIGEQLGFSAETVRTYLRRAVAKGYINIHAFDDPSDQIEFVMRSKVTRNLNTVLDETFGTEPEAQPSNRALEASLEIAKGTGLLQQHQAVKIDQQTNVGVSLKVDVVMPPISAAQSAAIVVRPGTVCGTPSTDVPVDAEIVGGG